MSLRFCRASRWRGLLTVCLGPTLRRHSWFLQNPHLVPGCVVLVASADADWNPRKLDERFESGSGQPVPSTGFLGDCFVLARVWPSAVLQRKDVYLRGRVREMLGTLDVSGNIVLVCPEREAVGSGCELGCELGDDVGYAAQVDVRIWILKANGGGLEEGCDVVDGAEAGATPGKRPSTLASSGTPSGSGNFATMSPSMRKSVAQAPSPVFLNSMSRGREGGRSSEKKKNKNKNEGNGGDERGRGLQAPSSVASSLPAAASISASTSAIGESLMTCGPRVNAVLQSLVRRCLRDTWLVCGSLYPFWFLDAYLGAVVTSQAGKHGPFRVGTDTQIVVRVGEDGEPGGRNTGGPSSASSSDGSYATAAVDAVRAEGDDGAVDASIESIVYKSAMAGFLSLASLDLEPTNRSSALLKKWVSYPLRNYDVFVRQGALPPTGVLLHGPPGTGKTLLARWVARDAGAKLFIVNGSEMMSEFLGDSERCLSAVFAAARALSPSIVFIDEIDVLGPSRSDSNLSKTASRLVATLAGELDAIQGHPVMVVGATNRKEALDESLRRPRRLEKELEIGVPDPDERFHILGGLLSQVMTHDDVTMEALKALSLRAYGYVGADLLSVASEASMIALRRYVHATSTTQMMNQEASLVAPCVTIDDLQTAMHHTKPSALREFSSDIPDVSLDDVGGYDDLKQRLVEAVEWPIKFKDRLDEMGAVPPQGVLLWGPPGCSKTLLVKAIAGECRLNFFSVKGPELISKYVGESEKTLANLFEKARKASPTILFFDEIDGLVGARSTGGGGGVDVGERVLSQMLQEMDGINGKDSQIVIIGATNRMDKLDKALLRPGRFDSVLEVSLPSEADRREILRIHMCRVPVDSSVDVEDLVVRTKGFSGAELAGAVQQAAMHALCDNAPAVRHSDFLGVLT
jgi:AAA family ATPase